MDDFCGVDRLQPPSAGRRDGPRLAVRADSQHLGGDQLDLLAGPLDSRAHPQITLGGNTAEQVDHDPAQPRVVALLTPFQPAHQQSRYGCGVLYRGGPRAAHHVRREKLFAEFVCCIEQFVIRVTHGRPAPGMSTVVASRRDSFVPTSRCGYALVLESMKSVRRSGPPSVQAIAVRSPMANAVNRRPTDSATISVLPSGVMTIPLGKSRSPATTVTVSSGSTRTMTPPSRAWDPTYARPRSSTTMSPRLAGTMSDRSATGATVSPS